MQQDEGELNRSISGEGSNADLYGDSRFGRADDAPASMDMGGTDGNSSVGRTEGSPEPEDDGGFGIRRTEGSDEGSDTGEFWRISQV
ncbi:MAG TPA: hypothetical protein VLA19_04385 [Herpetosiphonaceae bacterium]|nr:hypothetical protein [Herpetosiphonaceae bacterium]